MNVKSRKMLAWAGAIVSSALVVGAVAAAPFSMAEEATDASGDLVAQAQAYLDEAAIVPSEDWAETYPNEYESWAANGENSETTDYLEDYPYLGTLYEGNAFATDYKAARGHNYTLEDVSVTERKPAKANCLSCKTPQMSVLIETGDTSMYTIDFADALALMEEPVSCYNCHGNTGSDLVVTNTFLNDALGADAENVDADNLVCGQCHNEYYFAGDDKATALPYTSLDTMNPDDILAYYNEMGFVDYTNPQTGVEFIKVQHPEFETVMGEGFKMAGYTCADCHMGTSEAEDGTSFADHELTSPLDNEEFLENNCSTCHEDLAGEVAAIQEQAEGRTNEIGEKLADLTTKLAEAVEAGTLSDEDFETIASLNRDAMFYWDFVFVENSEGAHNSALSNDCLDKAEERVDEALAMLA